MCGADARHSETFELVLAVSEPAAPARRVSAGQAHTTTTVFAMLCDASVRTSALTLRRALPLTLVLPVAQSEGDYVVKCAWRFQAPASVDTADGRRIPLCIPTALLDGNASLEFVFFVWGACGCLVTCAILFLSCMRRRAGRLVLGRRRRWRSRLCRCEAVWLQGSDAGLTSSPCLAQA